MAKVKHTKTELKAQRDALRRYERFLPMLQLKKQQLQVEIQAVTARHDEKAAAEARLREDLDRWIKLLSEPAGLDRLVAVEAVIVEEGNIAGVAIPIFKDVRLRVEDYDLFLTPLWVDDAVQAVSALIRLRAELQTLETQRRLIMEELRVTAQRVNLFEKVKLPECRENIRVIRIYLGDEQTAGVARGKIAKRRATDEADAQQAGEGVAA